MSVHNRPVPRKRDRSCPPTIRRHQFLDAATWVFARKGYRHAGISDIIARAGVARGTFYLYFDSKEQVFLAIVEEFHKNISHAITTVSETPTDRVGDPRSAPQGQLPPVAGLLRGQP